MTSSLVMPVDASMMRSGWLMRMPSMVVSPAAFAVFIDVAVLAAFAFFAEAVFEVAFTFALFFKARAASAFAAASTAAAGAGGSRTMLLAGLSARRAGKRARGKWAAGGACGESGAGRGP